jgi:DNA-binding NtrC family response regulator
VSSRNKDNYYQDDDSKSNCSNNNINNKKYNSKIMVLDDDFDIATIVKMALQRNGFKNVSVFTESSLAIKEFRESHNNYSLVISDIRMPGMDGFEFANYINEIKPGIKVILMTAFDVNNNLLTENMKPTGNNNNIIQIIQKPISPKKLAKTVFSLH